jgi:deoxyribonuclease-4
MTAPRIGAHVSIAGGLDQAPLRAAAEGLETFQCFSRSPQGGPAPELTDELRASFRANMAAGGFDGFVIHSPYYINTASADGRIRGSSIRVLREELERGSMLGASFVMYHPGSHTGRPLEEGVASARDALGSILDGYTGSTRLLVEISAGAGAVLGDTFEEVAAIISAAKRLPGFGGICFDTCHAFASGYDFTDPDKAAGVLRVFDNTIGLQWLKLTHVNDSKTPLGEHKDRHEHVGNGHIGKAGLAAVLSTTEFRHIDWILETETEGRREDVNELRHIRETGGK